MEYYIDKAGKRRKGIRVNCKFCEKSFLTRITQLQKYCNRDCCNKHKSSLGREQVKCDFCGNFFSSRLSVKYNSKSGFRFCKRVCKDEAQRIGGIEEIMPYHYGTSETRNWTTLLQTTTNAECVGCNENRKYLLCVHHKDGKHENDNLDNLEIVCYNCHVRRHLKKVKGEWVYNTRALTPRELLTKL